MHIPFDSGNPLKNLASRNPCVHAYKRKWIPQISEFPPISLASIFCSARSLPISFKYLIVHLGQETKETS